jgi:hypothetical protein
MLNIEGEDPPVILAMLLNSRNGVPGPREQLGPSSIEARWRGHANMPMPSE